VINSKGETHMTSARDESKTQKLENKISPATDSSPKIRLVLVDDHPIVRLGLAALLGVQSDLELVGVAASCAEALQLVKKHPVDILLVDLRMPEVSGVETIQRIHALAPGARSIVLSSYDYDEEIHSAVRAGAQGYVHKQAPAEEILQAIRAVYRGKQAFPRRIAERLAEHSMTGKLSPREREVLELVAKGLTNKDVANTLHISQFTVRNHLNHINEKLEVTDRTEAIFIAIQSGIIISP
jgi:DNA-binding NarL/FixJ family response regulator